MHTRIPRVFFSFRILFLFPLAAILLSPVFSPARDHDRDVHPLFNLQSTATSPFPSNRFSVRDHRQNTGLRVNLPSPNCATHPSDCLDTVLLNQLDGFNTQPRFSIPFDGAIDPGTVNSDTVFLLRIGSLSDPDDFRPETIGINQVVWDPATLTLLVSSDRHLDQHTSYLLIVTRGVRDPSGDPIEPSEEFRELRRRGDSDDDRGAHARSYRELLARLLDEDLLEQISHGLSRREIAVASLFTTGSVTSVLEGIRDEIKAAPAPTVSFDLGTHGEHTVFPLSSVLGILFGVQTTTAGPLHTVPVITPALQLFPGSVGSIAFGKFSAMDFETSGGFIPAVPTREGVPAVQSTEEIFFNLFLPSGPRPANGWPVAIFGHGFGDNKNNSPLAVASVLAHNGIATIAINAVGHGFGAAGTLTVMRLLGPVVLSAGGRGVDQNGDGIIDSTEGLFATGAETDLASRDGLEQTVADLMQVVRAIQGGVHVDGSGVALDPSRIYYFGQSLGGIYGTVFLGIEPDVHAGVPNVPGGSLTDIARLSPAFRPLLGLFLAGRVPSLINVGGLNFDDNMPLRNQPPVINGVPGAIDIQVFEDRGNWLQQSADPVAWAPFVRMTPLRGEGPKNVIIQFAFGDETVPNPTCTALIRSGDLTDRATLFRNDLAFAAHVGFGKNPHAFLTNIGGAPAAALAAVEAQTQIAVFFFTNGGVTIDPDGLGPLFETPISIPLPEALNFIP
ncbi:MAG TPA: hypothetical protein VEU31_09455 [Candidatus Acidoferrales bacterium]|nr:hypothetical protein [Candidatus Acidoferrales bacterium]